MNTRFQVFISSTFKDLEKERKILSQTLLKKGCFPAGMEWFPAVDEEQFEYIKQVIDDTDYYVLILGGLYGTIAPDGRSYTEKEYDYAVEKGKKVIALVQKNPAHNETDDERIIKFTTFRKKVTEGRLVNFWEKPEELSGQLAISLDHTIKEYPAQGWIRCDSEKCDARLQLIDVNSAISALNLNSVRTIHIMASGTSSYISAVKNLLRINRTKKSWVDIYISFRLGNDLKRIDSLRNHYDMWWNKLKEEYPKIRFHFICQLDFKNSFRGIVVNRDVGLIGFYVRVNQNTLGTLEDCIYIDKTTDSGKYILEYFLKCFHGQSGHPTLKDCIDQTLTDMGVKNDSTN